MQLTGKNTRTKVNEEEEGEQLAGARIKQVMHIRTHNEAG